MQKTFSLLAIIILCAVSCRQPTERLEDYEIHGIDVSHYQGNIDWDKVTKQNIKFVFIKATEGRTMQDVRFHENWQALKDRNIISSAYHFFRPTISASAQAENFTQLVELNAGDLPPVLDVEVLDGVSPAELREGMTIWLNRAEKHYGIPPIIYTNLKFYNAHIKGHLDNYPLWIARYNYIPPDLSGPQEWQFWQYGNKGQISGINGDVDFNVFCSNQADLDSLRISISN